MDWGEVGGTKDVKVCHFEKHFGEKWEDVVEEDRQYVEWLVYEGPELSDDLFMYLSELLGD